MQNKKTTAAVLSVLIFFLLAGSIQAANKVKRAKIVITQIDGYTITATRNSKTYTINAERAELKNAKGKTATIDQIFTGDQIDVTGNYDANGIIVAKIIKDHSLKGTSLTRRNVGSDNLQAGAISDLNFISNGVITGDKIQTATITGANLATDIGINTTGNIQAGNITGSGQLNVNGAGNNYFAGNVGIGTANPGYKLDIVGDINIPSGSQYKINGVDQAFDKWTAGTGNDIYRLNGSVGIGTASPNHILDIVSPGLATVGIETIADGQSTDLMLMRARGTPESKTAVVNGDSLARLTGFGWDGSHWVEGGRIRFSVDGTVTSGYIMPGRIQFYTNNSTGSLLERMRIDSSGNVGIGTTAPAESLDINGQMKLKKNSAQPYACDAAHDSAVSLTNKYTTCVCKNGTGWVLTSDGTTACTWN